MKAASLAWKMLRRDWRCGELRVLVAALVIAVAAVTAINLLTDRFGRLLQHESAEMVGGDLVLQSSREPDSAWLQQARKLGLATAELTEFATAVVFADEFLLASVKAASADYPLLGSLRVTAQNNGQGDGQDSSEEAVQWPPTPGTVWVDARVLTRLQAQVGDRIELGATELRIDRVLTYEPDGSRNLFNLNPRILMNAADLAAADVAGPGSRIQYKYLFAGNANAIEQLRKQLQPQLGPGYQLTGVGGGGGRGSNVISRAEQYLGLTSLLAIFLAAIAIAMAARRYSERHYDVSGMLRCLGVQQRQLNRLYLWQLTLLAIFAALLGMLLGWLAHLGLLASIQSLLPGQLPAAGIAPFLTGFAAAVLLMLGVALPPVLRLKSVPPLRVFRRELTPLPVSGWLVYGAALVSISGLLVLLFDNITVVLLILLAVTLAIGVLGALLFALLKLLRRSTVLLSGRHLLVRSLRSLAGHTGTTTGQILSFGLTAMVMVILLLLRTDLTAQWQAQLPEDTPNNFAFNIQPFERDAFQQKLLDADIETRLYPIVRGRLISQPTVSQPALSDEQSEAGGRRRGAGPNRELNFTWAEQLPANNQIVSGQWRIQSSTPEVSIEQGLAQRMGIGLGDTLMFDIAGTELTAVVNSIRSVEWESFSPNFYVIFQPGVLQDFSTYYLTSFRLPAQQRSLLSELVREFPSVSLIEVDAIIEQLQGIIEQVTLMVEMILMFVLLAGVTVLLASIQSTLDERMQEGALMRAIGASRSYLRSAALAEFALLGLLAGLLAALGAELACDALYQRIFDMEFQSSIATWLLLPATLAVVVGGAGYLSTRKVLQVSPREILG